VLGFFVVCFCRDESNATQLFWEDQKLDAKFMAIRRDFPKIIGALFGLVISMTLVGRNKFPCDFLYEMSV